MPAEALARIADRLAVLDDVRDHIDLGLLGQPVLVEHVVLELAEAARHHQVGRRQLRVAQHQHAVGRERADQRVEIGGRQGAWVEAGDLGAERRVERI